MKKAITLFLAVMLVLTSIPAFAYSTTGAGMLSAYYQGDSTSPWQAEVTFEKSGVSSFTVDQMSKPIQYLQRTEKEIRTTAYFTSTPASATDAKLYTVLFADSDLVAVAVAPVDKTKLMATTTINMGDCVVKSNGSIDYSVNYFLRAYVWDGMTPMTQLREISTWSFNVDKITVDGTAYTHNANAAGGVFIDNGMGIIDIDESIIADKTNVNLKISMAASSNRKLIANGQEYSYTSGEGFVLNDVDLTNGLAFTIKADASTAHYYINPKAYLDFTPNNNNLYKSSSNSNTYTKPANNGDETPLENNLFLKDDTGAVVFQLSNLEFNSNTDSTEKTHMKRTLYNDNGRVYLRAYTDGTYLGTKAEQGTDISQIKMFLTSTSPNFDTSTIGSYVMDIRFKAKKVENIATSAANYSSNTNNYAHNVQFRVTNSSSSNMLSIESTQGSLVSLYGATSISENRFFGNQAIADNTLYTIRVYARRLADGTKSYRYYSHDPKNGYICIGSLDDHTNGNGKSTAAEFAWEDSWKDRWSSDVMKAINITCMANTGGKAFANDIYIDHIRLYKTTEVPAA